MAHTFTGSMAVKLNGTAVPEAGFNAAIGGDFGVPVVFVSGDQAIGNEATRLLGPVETVAVKQAIGFHAAVMMPPGKSTATHARWGKTGDHAPWRDQAVPHDTTGNSGGPVQGSDHG
jgi:D-amino peptidase